MISHLLSDNLINTTGSLDLKALQPYLEKPVPFSPGEPLFWDDPHISKHMLATHLDPIVDSASRKPETIDKVVNWITRKLDLHPGDPIIDLGCGPGLYTSRFAQRGLVVNGMDYSKRSIAYGRDYAREHGLDITYRYQNYLTLEDTSAYKAAFLIFGDFCPLSPVQRTQLLTNIHRALLPGGHFIFDVSTRMHRKLWNPPKTWSVAETGFWKPSWHLVLDRDFDYPDQDIYCNQSIVIEADGHISVYRNWFQDYTPDRIISELESHNFKVEGTWSDLHGTPYHEDTEWIGIVARKA